MDDISGKSSTKNDFSRLNADMLHTILELSSDGIWDWNANTGFVYRNPGWYEMLGYPRHALDNNVFTWENVIHPDDYNQVMTVFDDYINRRAPQYQTEYRCRKKDGSYLWIEDRGYVVARNPDGSVARMVGALRDIQLRKYSIEQLERRNQSLEALVAERTLELSRVNQQLQLQVDENRVLAERDALTLVANRYRLEKVLLQECERAQRFHLPLSLIAMDVDDFKPINDRHGHGVGDQTLVQVVERLESCVRQGDLLARWGGDEFMVVLPESSLETAKALAETICQSLRTHRITDDVKVTLSLGVVERQVNEAPAALMARADQALYRAKAAGKDGVST
ncbi:MULTISPECIES: diguanylate cyclase domain-containing protein [Pseudomonas]|jgi:diguanylate cyclase (GGDEF)-like protein/PAS domain S-box-containing protein|uniref:diguanylate cyclase n=2 Tax=Pseudomonas TaxID=286 RepID=A0A4Y9T8V4_PSEFL|nr:MULTISPECIES: diguanylate cyclase [Pseudomonas]CRM96373.1 putative diguanylate cyclase YdaM [Pseudomonas sp. 22 E 5]QXH66571.1 diguanylate cyclase [Pseudomonas asgharzadehiana]TFW40823.1 diguanylate cyclase [Pseudomonas fluorescens]CRM00719.1 putative diguanylate cyclase YdaM [Pseudomonas sp. 31 E 5]CRM43224.1 putative diguanylate cyclase YdaM [Pseudomonas sp. 31 E 6]